MSAAISVHALRNSKYSASACGACVLRTQRRSPGRSPKAFRSRSIRSRSPLRACSCQSRRNAIVSNRACGCSWAGNPTRDPPLQALFCRGGQPATQLFKKTKRTCAGTRHQTQTANPIGALSGSRTTYVLPSAWSGARTEGGLSRFPTMPPAWGA